MGQKIRASAGPRRMSSRNPSTISHIHRLIGASGSHAIKLVTVEVSAFRLSTLLRCRSLHTRKSAVGHSRPRHRAPVPTVVRCYPNSGQTPVRLEYPLSADIRRYGCHSRERSTSPHRRRYAVSYTHLTLPP